ncbi:MAG: hypothetical protein ABWY34_04490, partial [Pseudoxanthomonas sp.]
MFKQSILSVVFVVFISACQQKAPVEAPAAIVDIPASSAQSGALSGGTAVPVPVASKADVLQGTEWPSVELSSGEAFISCDADPAVAKTEERLVELSYAAVDAALKKCEQAGLVRLDYEGKIATDFTAL